jgi:hypothetical protein
VKTFWRCWKARSDRFWVPGMQIDSKTTIAGVPIIKVRDALRR